MERTDKVVKAQSTITVFNFCFQLESSGSYFRVMLEDGVTFCCLGIGVQFEHYPQVLQRILLQYSAVDLLAAMTT